MWRSSNHAGAGAQRPLFLKYTRIVSAFATLLLIACGAATAADKKDPRHYEIWAGADAAEHVWLIYTGATLAPFGDMHRDGIRLRAATGYGQYRYESFDESTLTKGREFRATTSYADALIGYLWRLDPLILKAFVGFSAIDHTITPFDAANRANGLDYGVKGKLEMWFNIGDKSWASVDLAWSAAHNSRSARARLGHRFWPQVSLGMEAGANVDIQGDYKITHEREAFRTRQLDYARGGIFARYQWDGGEISASTGLLGDFTEEQSAYGTINWVSQF